MHRFFWIAFCLLMPGPILPMQAVGQESNTRDEVDRIAEPYLKSGTFVGIAIGIVMDDRRHTFTYGETTKGSGEQPTAETIYEIGSITKVFTGILLADAVERGLVALRDPVQQHIPNEVTMPIEDGQPIRLIHLATHTSGLPRLPSNMPISNFWNPYCDYTSGLLLQFLNEHTLRRAPGKLEYSNFGMGLLGHILELKSAKSYEDLLIEKICSPLEMNDTRITLDEEQKAKLAPPYNVLYFHVKNWDMAVLQGAGAVRSNCQDMLTFIEAHFADDDRAVTQSLYGAQTIYHAEEGGMGLGLGWHRARDKITWWHSGQTGGYSAYLAIVPSHKLGVVVLANRATSSTTELGEKLIRHLFKRI